MSFSLLMRMFQLHKLKRTVNDDLQSIGAILAYFLVVHLELH
jgi:hypothetical protein